MFDNLSPSLLRAAIVFAIVLAVPGSLLKGPLLAAGPLVGIMQMVVRAEIMGVLAGFSFGICEFDSELLERLY